MAIEKINLKPIKSSNIDFSKIYKNSSDAMAEINSINVNNSQYWGDNGNQLYYDEQTGLVSEEQANGEMVAMGFVNKNSLNNVETLDISVSDPVENKNVPINDAVENETVNSRDAEKAVETLVVEKTIDINLNNSLENNAIKNEPIDYNGSYDGPVLTRSAGRITGPSGEETYYNLKMDGVVRIMRDMGFSEQEYPYHVREDGVKMLGDYIMVAANLDLRPRGSLIDTSLGKGIVCDTGGFAAANPTQLDIAVEW